MQPFPITVVAVVKTESETSDARKFYGLYNTGFVKRCFGSGNRLILSTNQKNTINTYIVDLDSGRITELSYDDGSQIVLDVSNDVILVNRRNYFFMDKLAVCKLPPKEFELPIAWRELTPSQVVGGLENYVYEYLDLSQNNDDALKTFSAIYVGPNSGDEKSVNLIVYPHGGPHSAFANGFSLETALFLSMGFSFLYVNYRGSTGAGQASIDFLPGKVGTAEVADCILATERALEKYPWLNPEGLVLYGGSHGGFVVTHLSGKYPDLFKAVVARNPSIDIPSKSIISDIPDLSYDEVGFEYTQVGKPSEDALLAMRRASPLEHAHEVKAPTLLQMGKRDLRVPHYQGLEFYHRLKANGTKVKVHLYDDNHPLANIPHEMDKLINSVLWFQQHLIG